MTPRIARPIVAALAAIVVFAVPVSAQEATTDPAAAAAEQAAAEAAAAGAGSALPRFRPANPGYVGCVNEPPEDQRVGATVPPGVDLARIPNAAGWQTSAPRGPILAGEKARLSLRDKAGTADRRVNAHVTRPDGVTDRSPTWLWGDRAGQLTYPSSFIGAPPLVPGTYTVIWRDTITDRFIACDGFEVVA